MKMFQTLAGSAVNRRILPALLMIACLALANPSRAFAYVDPNTMGFLSQTVAPLATLVVSCLVYFRRKLTAAASAAWRWLRRQPP